MSWIQENKGPAAVLGLAAAGAIGLGVVWFNTWSEATELREQFDLANQTIAGLKSAKLPPTPENLAKKQAMVEEYGQAVTKLNGVLTKLQPQGQAMSNTDFQSKLKKKVADIKKEAAGKLPAEFNLGFDAYENELPKSDALATELSQYLDAADEVVRLALKSGLAAVESLERSALSAESSSGTKAAPAAPTGEVTRRRTLTLTVRGDQPALQAYLSALASPSQIRFFTITRLLRIENEQQEGPARSVVTAEPPPDAGLNGAAAPAGNAVAAPKSAKGAPAPADSKIVLGAEQLRAYLEIDLVEFVAQQNTAPAPAPAR